MELIIRKLSLEQARRLTLKAQGFASSGSVNWRSLKRVLEIMQVLQIDAINTLVRSHYLPLFSRVGQYDRELLDTKLFSEREQRVTRRQFFEYWGHECSVIPIQHYPLLQWRRDDAKAGNGVYKQLYKLSQRNPDLVSALRTRVHEHGPLTSSDLETESRGSGMWEWSQTKQALEYLFWAGELASAGRRGFQRLYAAPETVIPQDYLCYTGLSRLQSQMRLLELAASALGVATETDLRDYFRLPAKDSKMALERLSAEGRLHTVAVEGWSQPAYVLPNIVLPRVLEISALLSPFDPIVWCRDRAQRLFNFHYRIEIYVPPDKRKFGYWVMPFMHRNELVARVDLKADREKQRLHVKGAWCEDNHNSESVAPELAAALIKLAQWLNLDHVVVGKKGGLAQPLRRCF